MQGGKNLVGMVCIVDAQSAPDLVDGVGLDDELGDDSWSQEKLSTTELWLYHRQIKSERAFILLV